MSEIKLIAVDMDGTLLDSNKQLPGAFAEVYKHTRDRGIVFVIASGRQYDALLDEFKQYDHDLVFAAENGGFIKQNGEVRLLNPFAMEEVKELIVLLRSIERSEIVLCGKNGAYVESDNEEFLTEMRKYYHKTHCVEDLLDVEDDLLKIAVCNLVDLESYTLPIIQRNRGYFNVSASSKIWVDIMPPGVNKGLAIEYLQKKNGVLPSETMVFGDYLNDYEMMQVADYSYAMANAHPDLFHVARYKAPGNDEDGVIKVIREYLNL